MKKYKRIVDNKARGVYGWSDPKKGIIVVNKKAHKDKKDNSWNKSIPLKDRTLINTIVHEENHMKHPKMHEDTIRKLTAQVVKAMPDKTKSKYYKRFS